MRGIVSSDNRAANAVHPRVQRVAHGERLYRNGAPANTMFVIRSGSYKTVISTAVGHEQVIDFMGSGDLLGLDGVGSGAYRLDAVALEDGHVCALPWFTLLKLAREVPALQERLFALLADQGVREREALAILGSLGAKERVSAFLLQQSEGHARRGYSSRRFVMRMSRNEIASYLGLTLETVCRKLACLAAEGTIRLAGRELEIVDFDRLNSHCSGAMRRPAAVPASPEAATASA
ncbi:MAG: Crp/Fnr family transcriptional regulator [Gammaproteobacteria bacterium]